MEKLQSKNFLNTTRLEWQGIHFFYKKLHIQQSNTSSNLSAENTQKFYFRSIATGTLVFAFLYLYHQPALLENSINWPANKLISIERSQSSKYLKAKNLASLRADMVKKKLFERGIAAEHIGLNAKIDNSVKDNND